MMTSDINYRSKTTQVYNFAQDVMSLADIVKSVPANFKPAELSYPDICK